MEPHALMIQGAVTLDWDSNPDTIDGVIVLQPIGAIITNTDPAEDVAVTNLFGHTANENKIVVAVWDESTTSYKSLQIGCP